MKIAKDMVINDIIKRYPKTMGVFNKFNVDSCCGGGQSIEKAAKAGQMDIEALLAALNEAAEK